MRQIIITVLLAAAPAAYATDKPTSYDDCLLQYAPQAQSTAGAVMVRQACRDKFPEAKPTPAEPYAGLPGVDPKTGRLPPGQHWEDQGPLPDGFNPFVEPTASPARREPSGKTDP